MQSRFRPQSFSRCAFSRCAVLRPRAILGALLASLLLPLFSACAGSGESGSYDGPPRSIEVSLQGYGSTPFKLVSESHTARVELYSQESGAASTKVLTDEVMVALLEHLDELGFRKHSTGGSAPAYASNGSTLKAIQVRDDGASAWWGLVQDADSSELSGFQTAMRDFLDLYNIAQSWQSVDNTLGADYFDRKKAARSR